MIKETRGDILKADVEALVNTVNCVGVMGRGIALQFKKSYPENFNFYKKVCDDKGLSPGKVLVYDLDRFINPRYIINFPTKQHWKGKSKLEYIDAGLKALVNEIQRLDIKSIAIPPLGCGLGGLDWQEVRSRIETALSELSNVEVILYEPAGAPKAKAMASASKEPNMTKGRAALLELMRHYLSGLMDPFISLLEVHKLMYFMQEAGENLCLKYSKARYGPYSENLRHVLNCIEGYFIYGYGDAEDSPEKEIELNHDVLPIAEKCLLEEQQCTKHLKRVTELIEGFETPFGMELLSTVHWVVVHEGAQNSDKATELIYAWNPRKKMFKRKHIDIAWQVLQVKGWFK